MDQGTGKLDTSYVELLSCGQTMDLLAQLDSYTSIRHITHLLARH